MANASISDFQQKLDQLCADGVLNTKMRKLIDGFYKSYRSALALHQIGIEPYIPLFLTFLNLIETQIKHPYAFQTYHARLRAPIDYFQFGLEFMRPLVDLSQSSIDGEKYINQIERYLAKGDNIILFANHQSEADPQAMNLLLEKEHAKLAEEMIFVAGERVLTDPLAVPFSLGCNLLCIYSKRYIDYPPESRHKKQLHNQRTMQRMKELLSEGGRCIYVAPSGGRDRPNDQGEFEVAFFDPQSIEMFYLMAKQARKTTHFFPLALLTHKLLPPPETVQIELGEARKAERSGIHLAFGPPIDMESVPVKEVSDKHERRKTRADFIWGLVNTAYQQLKAK